MVKVCSKCKQEKSTSEFTFNKNTKDKLTVWCKSCCKLARDTYYIQNKESIQKRQKEWREKTSDYRREKKKQKHREDPRKLMLYSARHRAKHKGLDFNIELDDIVIPDVCPVLGMPLILYQDSQQRTSPSLDRIDPTKGYTKGNIQVISWFANTMKQDANSSELLKFAEWIFENFKE